MTDRELDLPGLTVWIVPDKVNGGHCIRKWENHGLEAGTHRLVAEPLARREVEAAAALRQSPTVEEVAIAVQSAANDAADLSDEFCSWPMALAAAKAVASLYRGSKE
jgi:hypothetical protein